MVLSYFQSDDGGCGQKDGGNPETHGYFGFVPGAARPVLENVAARRVELFGKNTEVVVYRRAFEEALSDAFPLAQFEVFHLQYDAQAFNQEHAAKEGDEQFLVDDDGQHGNDAADGEGAGVGRCCTTESR